MNTASAGLQGQVAIQATVAPTGLNVHAVTGVSSAYALPHASDSLARVHWVPGSWHDASP